MEERRTVLWDLTGLAPAGTFVCHLTDDRAALLEPALMDHVETYGRVWDGEDVSSDTPCSTHWRLAAQPDTAAAPRPMHREENAYPFLRLCEIRALLAPGEDRLSEVVGALARVESCGAPACMPLNERVGSFVTLPADSLLDPETMGKGRHKRPVDEKFMQVSFSPALRSGKSLTKKPGPLCGVLGRPAFW